MTVEWVGIIVTLLTHSEAKEGFTLFPKGRAYARRHQGWTTWARDEGWSSQAPG